MVDMLVKLNSSIVAITNVAPTAPRGPYKPRKNTSMTPRPKNKFDGPPPYPCKYCLGEALHWGRDCPRLAELEKSKETDVYKHKLAA
eukprot:8936055-Pyramimonas_sp.AAC.1